MAAGEGGSEPPPPRPPSPLSPGPERALEEAAASGKLSLAGRRLRHFPGGAVRRWDLSDTTQADLSRNRFAEVPEDACHLPSLEGLSLYHNCLRSISPAIANLQALTYLNISRNQLTCLPACLCRLPLKILIASNNKVTSLPDDIGSLCSLRQLDVSSNELQSLPASIGGLESLQDLNVRRNQIASLPEELAGLPLIRLDFSCNRVTRIPVCYRRLRHLERILLENNPLQSPPAQICLKGRIHIFKYLNLEACSETRSDLVDFTRPSRPTGFGTCLPEDFYSMRQYGGLDSGFNSVDSGSKRWSGNESTDEFSDLSFRMAELARDPRQLKEQQHNGTAEAADVEQIDYIDSSVNGEDEEDEDDDDNPVAVSKIEGGLPGVTLAEDQHNASKNLLQKTCTTEQCLAGRNCNGASLARPGQGGEDRQRRQHPDILHLWQERERQQWSHGLGKQPRSLAESSSLSQPKPHSQGTEQLAGSPRQSFRLAGSYYLQNSSVSNPPATEPSSVRKPSSFLFRSSAQSSSSSIWRGSTSLPPTEALSPAESNSPLRLRTGCQAADERERAVQLRKTIQSQLNVTLPGDLGEALANGVVLCQLVNHLYPQSVPFIHVPSAAVPKLNAIKSRKNVESFLTACRQLQVPEVSLCSASSVLRGNGHGLLCLLEALLHPSGAPSTSPCLASTALSQHLTGFGVFYVSVMLLLYLAYCKLCGY